MHKLAKSALDSTDDRLFVLCHLSFSSITTPLVNVLVDVHALVVVRAVAPGVVNHTFVTFVDHTVAITMRSSANVSASAAFTVWPVNNFNNVIVLVVVFVVVAVSTTK